MSPHPSLSDWSDEQRFSELVATHRSGFVAGTQPVGVMPLDVSQLPDSCALEGAAPVAGYEDGIRAESERDPWLWKLIPAAIAAGAILTAWFEVAP